MHDGSGPNAGRRLRDPRYDILFEPVRIGPVTAKNRYGNIDARGLHISFGEVTGTLLPAHP